MLDIDPIITDIFIDEAGKEWNIEVYLSLGTEADSYYMVKKLEPGSEEPIEIYALQNAGDGIWIERDLGRTAIAEQFGRLITENS